MPPASSRTAGTSAPSERKKLGKSLASPTPLTVQTPNVNAPEANVASPNVATTPSVFVRERTLPGLEGLDLDKPEIRGPSEMVYRSRAFCCFRPAAQPRRLCIEAIESKLFEPIILTTILANCVTMAWESPLDPEHTAKADFINVRAIRARIQCCLLLWQAGAESSPCHAILLDPACVCVCRCARLSIWRCSRSSWF